MPHRCVHALLVFVLVASLSPARAVAQVSLGTIAGRVVDDRGAAVPTAIVTATRTDSSIVRRDVSGADGEYRLGLLPEGTYTVLVRRLGYRPATHGGILVRPRQVTPLRVELSTAATRLEAVSVGANQTEIRRDDTRLGTVIDELELSALPVGYDFQSIISFTPGARPDQVWGGSTDQANSYVVDGVALNHPGVGGAMLPLNTSWLDELEVTGLGAGAELGNFQGGLIRAVTKSGTNTFAGMIRASGEGRGLNGSNIGSTEVSSELQGRREVEGELRGPIVRDRLFYYLSGQVVQRDLRSLNHLVRTGFQPGPATGFLPTLGRHDERKMIGKLTWQLSSRDVVDASAGRIDLRADHYAQTGFEAPDAGTKLDAPTNFYNLSWRRMYSTRALLSVRAAGIDSDERRDPYGGPNVPGILNYELGGDRTYGNAPFRHRFAPRSASVSADADIFATSGKSDHHWKAGLEVTRSRYIRQQLRNAGMTWRPFSPNPTTFDPGSPGTWRQSNVIGLSTGGEIRLDATVENGAIYLQDRISFGDRLSVILGARHNWWFGALRPAAARTRALEAVRDYATEPRVGAILDLTGDGRTVLKVHAGRYHQHLFAQFFDRVEGAGVFTNEQFWYYTGPTPIDRRQSFNESERAQLRTEGTLRLQQEERLNEEGAVFNYRQPYMDQIVASVERNFGTRWKGEVLYVGRHNKRLVALVDRNLATNFTAFHDVRVNDRFGRPITDQNGDPLVLPVVYFPNDAIARTIALPPFEFGKPNVPGYREEDIPNLTYDPAYEITTAPGGERLFNQGQLSLTGRFPLWSITGSVVATKLVGNIYSVTGYDDPAGRGPGQFVRPNEAINAYGWMPNVTDLEAKLRISGALPFRFRGGAFLTAMRPDRITPSFTHSGLLFDLELNDPAAQAADTATIWYPMAEPLAGHRVLLARRGTYGNDASVTVDAHLERGFAMRGSELVMSLDGFNLLGAAAVTEINTAVNSQADPNATGPYGSVRARVPARSIRLGAAVRF